jgi:alpha-glucosidase
MKMPFAVVFILLIGTRSAFAQKITIYSPNKKIAVALFSRHNADIGDWYLKVSYVNEGVGSEAVRQIDLGLSRSDQNFVKELKFVSASKPLLIDEQYTAQHGKKSLRHNLANEVVVSLANPDKEKMNIILRAYNDGVVFRYEFPKKGGTYTIKDEMTSYTVDKSAKRWLEKWNTANEGLYLSMSDDKIQKQDWCYPALFKIGNGACWFLLHEADVDERYCGTKLSNATDESTYKLTFPDHRDGMGLGESLPTVTLPWKSPWRVMILGTLPEIVASTLVDDVSAPSTIKDASWIKPGIASWNYWSNNHGTKDFKIVCEFADLAAEMNWPYTLLDWEWDVMSNGGNLDDAIKYIHAKGVKPLMWYNSGGPHTGVPCTPRDRMLTHESRVEEFTKLKKMGVVGVKVDFFESEKQSMIKYYLDILKDAAKFEMMVYFHGCLVPRGWARTYPNLMTMESVRGAEWYNNTDDFSMPAPAHNATLPFTRNVIGAMDYTPVTFTNSQNAHLTSYGHELALSVLFESGLQHFADRPEGYRELTDAARTFLKHVPVSWDDTKLLDGYPGQDVIIARRKGNAWYIGGINGEGKEKNKTLKFDFLPDGVKCKLALIADGKHDKDLVTQYMVVDKTSVVPINLLRRGGFVAWVTAIE